MSKFRKTMRYLAKTALNRIASIVKLTTERRESYGEHYFLRRNNL